MKVIFISHYGNLYGANKSLLELVINLRYLYGIKPIVITREEGDFSEALKRNNIEYYIYEFYPWVYQKKDSCMIIIKKMIKNYIYNKKTSKELYKLFKNRNVSIVHTNTSVVNLGAIISKKLKIPHIWHIREFGSEDYNIEFFLGNRKAIRYMFKNSNKIIFISRVIEQKYKKYIPSKKKSIVIYNGIEDSNYISRSKVQEKFFGILFTGTIIPSKNQFELVKALEILINKKNKKDIKVYFLGDGDNSYINKIKKFIKEKNMEEYIFFEGYVKDIKPYLEKCKIGVMSSFNEAFGRVTIEYMLAGLVVVASNKGANLEIINDKETGLIYNLGDESDLANKILYLYNNPNIVNKISKECKKYAKRNFTSNINTKNIYNIYHELERNKL